MSWMRRGAITFAGALVALVLSPAAASAVPASGPHETVDVATSTTQPGASAGLSYAARYHAVGNPSGDPPALRHLLIDLPPSTEIDTSVPPRCSASDLQIMLQGESACPANARVGNGQVTVKQTGTGAVSTYDTVLYNADHDLLELVVSGGRVLGIAHTHQHGTTLDGPVPTCLTGGNPPDGCPFDELKLLSNHLEVSPVSVREGSVQRNYGTTPPTCPASGYWQTRVTLTYADGSVDTVTPKSRCSRPPSGRTGTSKLPHHRPPTMR
jgi:hypothetical protein